jgi:RNA polymerase sigma factor (sigma-70 family)
VAEKGERPRDAELVRAAREGDKEAFGLLIDRYRPLALSLVRQMLFDSALAEDAVQEAAVAALLGLDRLRVPDRFGAWYAAIALNLGRRWLRQMTRQRPIPNRDLDDRPGPHEQAEAAELAGRVRNAIEALPPGQRQAVLAFYWQGLSHAEAAIELGIEPGAVKARLHQARVALEPQLASIIEIAKEDQAMEDRAEGRWIDVEVTEVRRSSGDDPIGRPHAVVLQEVRGERRLPIYVGAPEAIALACSLEAAEMPRPMTYQLAANLVTASGARVAEVRITRLAESTFYAVVVLDGPVGPEEVDARPSDALNLALVAGAPIKVDSGVINDPECLSHKAWEDFPTGAAELVAEMRERQGALLTLLSEGNSQQAE